MSRKPLTDKDGEVRELTAEDFSLMRPLKEVHPEIVEAFKALRGRPPKAETKQPVSLRLSAQIIAHFKKDGKGWQTRIEKALQEIVERG